MSLSPLDRVIRVKVRKDENGAWGAVCLCHGHSFGNDGKGWAGAMQGAWGHLYLMSPITTENQRRWSKTVKMFNHR